MTLFIPGTNYLTKPNIGGAFSFSKVPEGTYALFFDPTDPAYFVKIIEVTVTAGEVTDLDTILLYSDDITGIPKVNAGNDTTVSINDTITLHGIAEDDYGIIIKMWWDIGNANNFIETETDDTTITVPSSATDSFGCVLRAVDNDGNFGLDTINITVLQDLPIANAGNDTAVGRNENVQLRGSQSTDSYGTIMKYEWDIGNTGSFIEVSNGDTNIVIDTFNFKGINCILRVTDDDGGTGSDTMVAVITAFLYEATSSAAFPSRSESKSVTFLDKMWVIAGMDNNSNHLNDVWYSTDGLNWTVATDNASFSARREHALVVFDNKIWVIAGDQGSNEVWYSTDGQNWVSATNSAEFSHRNRPAPVVFNNKLWIIGGEVNAVGPANDVWYSDEGATWTQAIDSAAFSGRFGHASVVFDNKIWVIGGSGGTSKNDVWCSDDGIDWIQITNSAVFDPRHGHSALVYDNKIWITGEDIWCSSDGINWTQVISGPPVGPLKRAYHATTIFNNRIWIINDDDVWYLK